MNRRFQIVLVLLSVALQLADASLAVLGHQHGDAGVAQCGPIPTIASHTQHGHSHCHHHHAAVPSQEHASHPADSQPSHSPHESDDDCSLCRHFSQSATAATAPIELAGSEAVEPLVVIAPPVVVVRLLSRHRSRGPPLPAAV